jgi:anti-sigma B factor antagonist
MPQALVDTSSKAASRYAAPPPFICMWKEGGSDAAWVHVAGELDLASAPCLGLTLRETQLHARMVVLDLRELTSMDSSGVHVILDAVADIRRAGGRLLLIPGPAHVDRVFTLTGACDQVEILDLDPTELPARALLRLTESARGEVLR